MVRLIRVDNKAIKIEAADIHDAIQIVKDMEKGKKVEERGGYIWVNGIQRYSVENA
jgi:hypothetical protein